MTQLRPMLAENLNPKMYQKYLDNPEWFVEQKLDGVRYLVHIKDGRATPYKRSGNIGELPRNVTDWFADGFNGEWVFDGEFLNNTLWVFDMPVAGGRDFQEHNYADRRAVLENFLGQLTLPPGIKLLPCAKDAAEKRKLYDECEAQNAEGVMFKHRDLLYHPGARHPKILKCKFVQSVDCIIGETNIGGKENAALYAVELQDGNPRLVEIGKCSLIGKPPVKPGDVVEVRYLYATEDRRLYQPRLMRKRDDKLMHECTIDQLKFTSKEVLA